jgi:hypothetical protein
VLTFFATSWYTDQPYALKAIFAGLMDVGLALIVITEI